MAAPFADASALTKADTDPEVGIKRAHLKEQGDARSQVHLRARTSPDSPDRPSWTHKRAALALGLALALIHTQAPGDASALKAPFGAGAPLLTTTAQAVHYRGPPRWKPFSKPLCSRQAHRTTAGKATVAHQTPGHHTPVLQATVLHIHAPTHTTSALAEFHQQPLRRPQVKRVRGPFNRPPHAWPKLMLKRKQRKRFRYPQYSFNSTLGFPGEGPKIVSYNINGAKTKISAVLAEARFQGVDALLIQEVHYYTDRWHDSRLGLNAECNRQGWQIVAAHGLPSDPCSGCAVIINGNSSKIKFTDDRKPNYKAALDGRFISVEVIIGGATTWLSSVYLNANAAKRGIDLDLLESERDLIHKNSIIGGDFNCVADTNLDTKLEDGNSSSTYGNDHNAKCEALTAHFGLCDIYRLHHGDKAGGFTRYNLNTASRIATRIDRIYAPRHHSPWRWTSVTASHTLFSSDKTKSNHLPVVASVETAKARKSTIHELNIDSTLSIL